ncbi:MAG: hypothetical protein QOJ23_5340 [Actinomycetota bacterium]|jgi:hypothetical protein|nr:hypothetical protein [Actinomycetota bacterium]MDQ1497008.1 hypothetical protein [Actinomycetota bacterium]
MGDRTRRNTERFVDCLAAIDAAKTEGFEGVTAPRATVTPLRVSGATPSR